MIARVYAHSHGTCRGFCFLASLKSKKVLAGLELYAAGKGAAQN